MTPGVARRKRLPCIQSSRAAWYRLCYTGVRRRRTMPEVDLDRDRREGRKMTVPAGLDASRARWRPSLGAWPEAGGTRFRVWAPTAQKVWVDVDSVQSGKFAVALERFEDGTFGGLIARAGVGDRYAYRMDDCGPYPDPASRFQPEGVHGPSLIVDP